MRVGEEMGVGRTSDIDRMDGTGSWQNHGEAETWEGEDTTFLSSRDREVLPF